MRLENLAESLEMIVVLVGNDPDLHPVSERRQESSQVRRIAGHSSIDHDHFSTDRANDIGHHLAAGLLGKLPHGEGGRRACVSATARTRTNKADNDEEAE